MSRGAFNTQFGEGGSVYRPLRTSLLLGVEVLISPFSSSPSFISPSSIFPNCIETYNISIAG